MSITIAGIFRYPVKGLSAESLSEADLENGRPIPHDRRFALADGSVPFDPGNPAWIPKTKLLTLLDEERLARLRVRFDPATGNLALQRDGHAMADGLASDDEARERIGALLAEFLGAPGGVRLLASPDLSFSDTEAEYVSILNLASVVELERSAGAPVDPRRFRANLHLDGLAAWEELRWPGSELRIGDVRLEVVKPIGRCAATGVDPDTAERDLDPPGLLKRDFGHAHMGVYASVIAPGRIRQGMPVERLDRDREP